MKILVKKFLKITETYNSNIFNQELNNSNNKNEKRMMIIMDYINIFASSEQDL